MFLLCEKGSSFSLQTEGEEIGERPSFPSLGTRKTQTRGDRGEDIEIERQKQREGEREREIRGIVVEHRYESNLR